MQHNGYESGEIRPYQQYEEIEQSLSSRYASCPEVMLHLSNSPMHSKSHTMHHLAVHLPIDRESIVNREQQEAVYRARKHDINFLVQIKPE